MKRYFQKDIETAPVDWIKSLQKEKLIKQVKYVYDNNKYYHRLMDEKGVTPDDIKELSDISKLPFLTKNDLREAYPYGLLSAPLKDCVRIQSTSGTTGRRVVAFYTQHDLDLWEECCARAIVAAGGTDEDVVQVCYGYGLFTGGPGLHGGSHKVGSLTIPMSSGNTDRQIQFMRDLGSTILCCTPSYAAYIGERLHEMGCTHDDIRLKAGILKCVVISKLSWESRLTISTDLQRFRDLVYPSNARSREACTSTRIISLPRSSILTQEKFFLKVRKVSLYLQVLIRKHSRFSDTEQETLRFLQERSAPADVLM